jgi:hypothetical protein
MPHRGRSARVAAAGVLLWAFAAGIAVGADAMAATPPAVTVVARPSRTDVTVGEPFVVDVEARGPSGAEWSFPAEPGDEKVRMTPVAPDPQAPPPKPGVARYTAEVFAVGDVELPAVAVSYRLAGGEHGEVSSAPVALRVGTLLPKNTAEQKLADVRPPVAVRVGAAFWIALAAAAALLAAGVVVLVRRRRRRGADEAAVPAVPVVPPAAEALAALEKLAAAGYVARGEFRAFYIALADIVKHYLGRRLNAPVPEMTSAEVSLFARDHVATRDLLPVIRDLATAADYVKFARGEAEDRAAERHLAAARGLVADVERRMAPPEVPTHRDAAGREATA